MKKALFKSVILTTIINALGCFANLLCATLGDFLLIKIHISGGEYDAFKGFGIALEHFYPLTDGTSPGKITEVSFDFLNLLFCFIIVFIIVFLILFLINKGKEKNG